MSAVQVLTEVSINDMRPYIDPNWNWSKEFTNLVTSCWSRNPLDRPTFDIILKSLMSLPPEDDRGVHIY